MKKLHKSFQGEEVAPFGKPSSPAYQRFGLFIDLLVHELSKDFSQKDMKEAVFYLSKLLTKDRGQVRHKNYLKDKRLQAAYCAHFLPWNVYRLVIAWKTSPLLSLQKDRLRILDLGAGPLTGLIALWVSGAIENRKLEYHALDQEPYLIDYGARFMEGLGFSKAVSLKKLSQQLNFSQKQTFSGGQGRYDLLFMMNVLNEWTPSRGRREKNLENVLAMALSQLSSEGELSLVEPATRLSSWSLMVLRSIMLQKGIRILAPCTHQGECPLLTTHLKSWCHFRFKIKVHKSHLQAFNFLGKAKKNLSLSYLHARQEIKDQGEFNQKQRARIISDIMATQRQKEIFYACSPDGKLQVESQERAFPQALRRKFLQGKSFAYRLPQKQKREGRSQGIMLPLSHCDFKELES